MIVCCGCSFTRYKWETWVDYLKIFNENIPVKNLGMSGSGNETISRMAVNASLKIKNIKKMYIMWSGADRYEVIQDKIMEQETALATYHRYDPDFGWHVWFGGHPDKEKHEFYQKNFLDNDHSRFKTLEKIYYTQLHLDKMNIDYEMMFFKSDVIKHKDLSHGENALYNKINWNKFTFYKEKLGLYDFAMEKFPNEYIPGDQHPLPISHFRWLTDVMLGGKIKFSPDVLDKIITRSKQIKNAYRR